MSLHLDPVAVGLAVVGLVLAFVSFFVSLSSLRRKLSAERHFADTVRVKSRANREKIRSLVETLSQPSPDESAVREAESVLTRYLEQIEREDLLPLLEGVSQPSLRGRAAYMRKLLKMIEREKITKKKTGGMRPLRRDLSS